MNASTYKNLEELSYGELVTALENIKNKIMNSDVLEEKGVVSASDANYYNALVAELDKRQKVSV